MSESPMTLDRRRFDEAYDRHILHGDFFEKPPYYHYARERYWESLVELMTLPIAVTDRVVELGGGQICLLLREMFGMANVAVADVNAEHARYITDRGIAFIEFDIMNPSTNATGDADLVVMLEVIEHIPVPGYIVLERLRTLAKPTGRIFLTTPNLFRLPNLVRMARGRDFLDRFSYAEPGQALGHQLEYTKNHLAWQIERAGMQSEFIRMRTMGEYGFTTKARLARRLLSPLTKREAWRDGMAASMRV
jgi:SAM-dependent methyltransferase